MRRDLRELRRHPRRMCRPAAASVAPPTTGGGVGAAQDILNEPLPLVPALEVRGRRRVAQDLRHVRGGVGGLSRRQRRREREREGQKSTSQSRLLGVARDRTTATTIIAARDRGLLFVDAIRPPSAPPLPPLRYSSPRRSVYVTLVVKRPDPGVARPYKPRRSARGARASCASSRRRRASRGA